MLNVIIVDDEPLIRIGLHSCVDWEQLGFRIVGNAGDGKEAVAMIESMRVDVAFTDIRMPNMDGLDLLRYLRKEHPKIKVIVLSSYNELDYVKQAMKMGAEDYILKLSLDPEKLTEILKQLRVTIEQEQQAQKSLHQDAPEGDKQVLREECCRQFLSENMPPDIWKNRMRKLGYQTEYSPCWATLCGIDNFAQILSSSRLENPKRFRLSVLNMMRQSLQMFSVSEIMEEESGRYLLLIPLQNFMDDEEKGKSRIAQFGKSLSHVFQTYFNFSVSTASILMTGPMENLPAVYQRLENVYQFKFYSGNGCILFSDDVKPFLEEKIALPMEVLQKLRHALVHEEQSVLKNVMEDFFDTEVKKKLRHPNVARSLAFTYLAELTRFAQEKHVCMEKLVSDGNQPLFRLLYEQETLEDMEALLLSWSENLIAEAKNIALQAGRREVALIKQYIEEHIDETISLERAAGICSLSKCYFSSIFKRETGLNFVDYLNTEKMKFAKQQMVKKGIKTYEAARLVGISDESYFSKLFKKYLGVTPSSVK